MEAGKGHLERDLEGRRRRWQILQEGAVGKQDGEDALRRLAQEEERRVLAKCKIWTTADFEAVCLIGKGGFGVVHLVKLRDTEEHFALKQMRKSAYEKKNVRERVIAERDLLAERRSRWFVKLFTTFQDAEHIYMVMEFLQGGDLVTHIYTRKGLSPEATCFYMAELIEAVDTVHRYGFIHRDIKPENIVLRASGHLKLLDFGLCSGTFHGQALEQQQQQQTTKDAAATLGGSAGGASGSGSNPGQRARKKSVVGTPIYCAPEMFEGSYGQEVDLWSVGTVIFECLAAEGLFQPEQVGRDPGQHHFFIKRCIDNHVEHLANKIRKHRSAVPPSAEQLLLGLVSAARQRLTAAECREEPFFAGLDFRKLHLMQPPLNIEVDALDDTRHFDLDFVRRGEGDLGDVQRRPRRELPEPRPIDIVFKDRNLEWAHYEFDSRAQ